MSGQPLSRVRHRRHKLSVRFSVTECDDSPIGTPLEIVHTFSQRRADFSAGCRHHEATSEAHPSAVGADTDFTGE